MIRRIYDQMQENCWFSQQLFGNSNKKQNNKKDIVYQRKHDAKHVLFVYYGVLGSVS